MMPLSVCFLPTAHGAAPEVLASFSGTLAPGEITTLTWQLNQNVPEPGFLFHYTITGGSDLNDVIYVIIEETGDSWDYLIGQGWTYCSTVALPPCPLDAGSYSVTIEAEAAATGQISYEIAFTLPPEPSVDFSGQIPANSDVRISSFGVLFPIPTSSQLVLGVTSGSYEFFIDGESGAVVTSTMELTVDLTAGFHQFEVDAEAQGVGERVAWSVQIPAGNVPTLSVVMVNPCPTLNITAGQSVCITGAEVTASDGSSPVVTYSWSASGGSFNSTSSQWVEWTAPQTFGDFSLTVEVSAPGYASGTSSLTATVVPEFPTITLPFILAAALALLVLSQRPRRHDITRSHTPVSRD
jgi:hypothetical protein